MVIAVYLFCLYVLAWSVNVNQGATLEATVRCVNQSEIYIDGWPYGETTDWKDLWIEQLPEKSRLIAIRCYNNGSSGGLIASLTNGMVTDRTWRCRRKNGNGRWYSLDTDDDSWPWGHAHVIPASRSTWDTYGVFPDEAKWIWKNEDNTEKGSSLCRAILGISISIRCSGPGNVYADGNALFRCNVTKTHNIIPKTTRVVAVHGTKADESGFIEASFSSGYGTDTSWKCSGVWHGDWATVDFDDSHWKQAADVGPSGIGSRATVRKIWTRNSVNERDVFCRGRIECGCQHQCVIHEDGFGFNCLCYDGYILLEDGFSCDKDECQERNAGCSGICINTVGSYRCECLAGFELARDMHSCVNINECERGTHNCSSMCEDTVGETGCICLKGFKLQEDNMPCIDTGEVGGHSMTCTTLCVQAHGNNFCGCASDVELNSDVFSFSNDSDCDAGSHNCSRVCEDATSDEPIIGTLDCTQMCKDTEGGFHCTCPIGYELREDMVTCQDVDECSLNEKPCSQICINTVGAYFCNCSDGYSLSDDGHKCLGGPAGKKFNKGIIGGVITAVLVVFTVLVVVLKGVCPIRSRKTLGPKNKVQTTSKATVSQERPHSYHNVHRDNGDNKELYENVSLHWIAPRNAHSYREALDARDGQQPVQMLDVNVDEGAVSMYCNMPRNYKIDGVLHEHANGPKTGGHWTTPNDEVTHEYVNGPRRGTRKAPSTNQEDDDLYENVARPMAYGLKAPRLVKRHWNLNSFFKHRQNQVLPHSDEAGGRHRPVHRTYPIYCNTGADGRVEEGPYENPYGLGRGGAEYAVDEASPVLQAQIVQEDECYDTLNRSSPVMKKESTYASLF